MFEAFKKEHGVCCLKKRELVTTFTTTAMCFDFVVTNINHVHSFPLGYKDSQGSHGMYLSVEALSYLLCVRSIMKTNHGV